MAIEDDDGGDVEKDEVRLLVVTLMYISGNRNHAGLVIFFSLKQINLSKWK